MKILITGGCGFVGSNLAIYLRKNIKNLTIFSLDNLCRKGSELNKKRLAALGIKNFKIDIENSKKILKLPKASLIIDCCAEPSVELSKKDPDRVLKTNFFGTFNVLKKCIQDNSKIIFLSSSRVYSIAEIKKNYIKNKTLKINENFDTNGIKSLYGLTKLSSEQLIKEISYSNNLKYIINRFSVISGPWQFGKQDQGFVTLWIANHILKKSLKYIGFGGQGNQSRDIIHIDDVCKIIFKQIKNFKKIFNQTFNIGGGRKNFISLKQLTYLSQQISKNKVKIKKISKTSNYDIPYFLTDNKKIKKFYKWKPEKNIYKVVSDIYFWLLKNKNVLKILNK